MRIQYIFEEEAQAVLAARISGVLVDLARPLVPVRHRLRPLVRVLRQGPLRLHNDVDLLPAIHLLCGTERHLITHFGRTLLVGSAAPVHIHLRADNEVQREREREASRHKLVVHLLRSGEQPRDATRDLRDDGKGGELACAARTVVLCDLRELREKA